VVASAVPPSTIVRAGAAVIILLVVVSAEIVAAVVGKRVKKQHDELNYRCEKSARGKQTASGL
jgi:hypothetical protein